MRQQNFVQFFEAKSAFQQLPLRAFTAINHEAIFFVHDHLRRQPAPDGRGGSRSAEKSEFKHNGS